MNRRQFLKGLVASFALATLPLGSIARPRVLVVAEPVYTYGEIVARTIEAHREEIVANIFKKSTLLERLRTQ